MLLILAGVSINMLTGQNGILNRAKEAKEKTESAQKEENEKVQVYEDIINIYATGNLPKSEGTTPYLPDSTFSYKEGNLITGLVIEDANENEYVWVEVPRTTTVYQTAGTDITNFTDEEYTKIETDLKKYTSEYKDPNYSDTNEDFMIQYKNMLKSVYNNGGFWIGRYEAGIEEGKDPRTSNTEITANDKSVIKPNMYPYNYVTRDDAQELATRMKYESCTGSLIFGIQWDLILKCIENKNPDQKAKLTSNSIAIGNYNNNLWNITNVNAKYSINFGSSFEVCPYQKKSINSILLTTGADNSFSLMNVYDIAGNVLEWTREFYTTENPCVNRGGSYYNTGLNGPAKLHTNSNTSSCNSDVGFRIGLWK